KQIQAQGSKSAGDRGTQFGQVQSDINQAAQGVSGQVNAGYAPLNQGVISAAAADPTGFAADPNNVKAFQGQFNDQYTGQTNFESTQPYSDVQGQVSKAVDTANLFN